MHIDVLPEAVSTGGFSNRERFRLEAPATGRAALGELTCLQYATYELLDTPVNTASQHMLPGDDSAQGLAARGL